MTSISEISLRDSTFIMFLRKSNVTKLFRRAYESSIFSRMWGGSHSVENLPLIYTNESLKKRTRRNRNGEKTRVWGDVMGDGNRKGQSLWIGIYDNKIILICFTVPSRLVVSERRDALIRDEKYYIYYYIVVYTFIIHTGDIIVIGKFRKF